MKTIQVPMTDETVESLEVGDQVLLNGTVLTGRDAAHKRLCDLLADGKELPVDLQGQVIYFTGPSPAQGSMPTGSAGPTTSYRMDSYSPILIAECGLKGMIGKGNRSDEVVQAMQEHKCVYFAATGGAGALIATCIKSAEVLAYEDLGPEAIRRMEVVDLPVTVAIDCHGRNLYTDGPAAYRERKGGPANG